MWPECNTSFVVIHGIGVQRPFETLDKFTCGFWNMLKMEDPDQEIKWHHKLLRHEDWIEHYISLVKDNSATTLDFHEFYWDCYMVSDVKTIEIMQWLDKISKGLTYYYQPYYQDEKKKLQVKGYHQKVPLFKYAKFKDDELKCLDIFRPILSNFGLLKRLSFLYGAMMAFWPSRVVLKLIVSYKLKDKIQDIVTYTTSDTRSQCYAVRQQVLTGAVEGIKLLLYPQDRQIILAGHSIGSVIAYDVLNRIILDVTASGGVSPNKLSYIGGLVTFGSPLDKIYTFFNKEPTEKKQFVMRQILSHLNTYKGLPQPQPKEEPDISNPFNQPLLGNSTWLNFYHLSDWISGKLDFYDIPEKDNIECYYKSKEKDFHGGYFTCNEMYKEIADRFFKLKLDHPAKL